MLGVFWPAWLYKSKEDLIEYKGIKGCIRDESRGVPIRAIRLTKRHEDGVIKLTSLADSATAMEEGQTDTVWGHSKRKLEAIAVASKRDAEADHDTMHTLNLPKAKQLKRGDSSSSNDFLSDISCPFQEDQDRTAQEGQG